MSSTVLYSAIMCHLLCSQTRGRLEKRVVTASPAVTSRGAPSGSDQRMADGQHVNTSEHGTR